MVGAARVCEGMLRMGMVRSDLMSLFRCFKVGYDQVGHAINKVF